MGEWSSTSSDSDIDFSRRRARQRRSVNDDRGVIKREAWADGSATDSSSGSESDDIPLAQTEMQPDASSSDDKEDAHDGSDTTMDGDDETEETEDVGIRIKAEEQQEVKSAGDSDASENEDDDGGDEEAGADESEAEADDEEETEDVDIRIKAETPPEERSSTGDNEPAETVDDDDNQDNAEEAVRGVISSRARPRKAMEDSESEWDPEEDGGQEDDEETQAEVHDDTKQSNTRHENDDGEDDGAEDGEQEDEDDAPEPVGRHDFDDAQRFFVQLKRAHLSTTEGAVLWDGGSLSGPPIDRPLNQADQWKRKYRWPVAMRNVRRRNFAADAKELSEVYEVPLHQDLYESHGPSAAAREAFAAALAPTVRPLMETAIAASREQSRKRRRETGEEPEEKAVDLSWLRTVTRLGGHYTDQLLDSILVKNVLSLQGIDASYPQQCWDPLPTSKRPIANWRFVLEHFCKSSTHEVDAPVSSPCPKLRRDTLIRIRDRLRTLYGLSWRPEDDEFFNLVDRQELDPPDLADEETLQL